MSDLIPAQFSVARYQFTLEALDPLHLPPLKGPTLRGCFGRILKRMSCFQPRMCDTTCKVGTLCYYGYIFETAPPPDSEVLANLKEIPRPFLIQCHDLRKSISPGEKMTFGLTLIGKGIKYSPLFISVFNELGKGNPEFVASFEQTTKVSKNSVVSPKKEDALIGLGNPPGRYQLLLVETVFFDGHKQPIYTATDQSIWGIDSTIHTKEIMARAATLPTDRITLNFLTPTRLKHQKKWVRQGPSFEALVKVLLGRVSSLSYFHCDQQFETEFRGLIDQATEVRIVKQETRWEDWSRFSWRQKQEVKMGGLVGRVTYAGDLAGYLPLLALGELVHVGKGTVFGNGQYEIESKGAW